MAKDMLATIRTVEEECEKREAEAQKLAEEKIAQANIQAKKVVEDAQIKEANEVKKRLSVVAGECEKTISQAKADSMEKCNKIGEIAEKNRSAVVKEAVKILIK